MGPSRAALLLLLALTASSVQAGFRSSKQARGRSLLQDGVVSQPVNAISSDDLAELGKLSEGPVKTLLTRLLERVGLWRQAGSGRGVSSVLTTDPTPLPTMQLAAVETKLSTVSFNSTAKTLEIAATVAIPRVS